MSAITALEPVKSGAAPALLPSANDLRQLIELGGVLVKSGLLPQSIRTPEAAATIILKGIELNVPAMAAIENIAVVNGKAVVGSHLLLALVKRTYGPAAMWVSETTAESCTISYRIPGLNQVQTFTYRMRDAETAGLAGKPTWKQHPAAMLRARAISAAAKLAFPEVVGGLYVAGELPETAELVTEDGEVIIDVTGGPAPEPTSADRGGGNRPRPEPTPEPTRTNRPRPQAGMPPELVEADVIEVDPETGEIVESQGEPEPAVKVDLKALHGDIKRRYMAAFDIDDVDAHAAAKRLGKLWFRLDSLKDITPETLYRFRKKLEALPDDELMAEDSAALDMQREATGRLIDVPARAAHGEPGDDAYTNR